MLAESATGDRTRERSVAVLMVCHNRRDTTLACLRAINDQVGVRGISLRIILVDDGSTDGTSEAVRNEFAHARIIEGDGSLYWNGAMREAFVAAMHEEVDFHLWVNDDTMLERDALSRLVRTFDDLRAREDVVPIVVGSLRDPHSGQLTYGGAVAVSRLNPLRFRLVTPASEPQECDTFNGNLVLIPAFVAQALGNLDHRFRHRAGDYEYALRAKAAGFRAYVAPGYFGTCSRNVDIFSWIDGAPSAMSRVRRLLSPKGFPPSERYSFLSRYGGKLWPLQFFSVYIRFVARQLSRQSRR